MVLPADHLITDEALFRATRCGPPGGPRGRRPGYLVSPPAIPTASAHRDGEVLVTASPPWPGLRLPREAPPGGRPPVPGHRRHLGTGYVRLAGRGAVAEIARLMTELHQGLLRSAGPGHPRWPRPWPGSIPGCPARAWTRGFGKSDRLGCPGRFRLVGRGFLRGWPSFGRPTRRHRQPGGAGPGRGGRQQRGGRPGAPAALLGVSGLTVVVTEDVVMVLPTKRCQEVRRFIEALEGEGAGEYL